MFDISKEPDETIVLSGRFDAAQIQKAESVFSSVEKTCLVDMKDLQYISSAGLGILLKTYVRIKPNGHVIRLKNLNHHIQEVIKYSGLDKVFVIED